jgi:hypothetical protein
MSRPRVLRFAWHFPFVRVSFFPSPQLHSVAFKRILIQVEYARLASAAAAFIIAGSNRWDRARSIVGNEVWHGWRLEIIGLLMCADVLLSGSLRLGFHRAPAHLQIASNSVKQPFQISDMDMRINSL